MEELENILEDINKESIPKISKYKSIKMNLLRAFLIICLLGTFFMIFGFSSQNAEESGGLSEKVTITVTKNVKKIQNLEQTEKEKVLSRIETVIRKIAHFSIYTLVGFLLMAIFSTYNLNDKNRILASLAIGVIYASSDEIHQRFVAGRSGQITDVMIDTMGVTLGILLVMLIIGIAGKIKFQKN